MKSPLIAFFSIVAFSQPAISSQKDSLGYWGTISEQVDKQTFSPNCSAIREVPVISGHPDTKVQTRLNAEFAKILTLGKKLQKNDCPLDQSETYVYQNLYTFGGTFGKYIGLNFTIYFPGGSGRTLLDCRIFDLESGDEVRLKKDFLVSSLPQIQSLFSESIDKKYEPEGLTPETKDLSGSPFCLMTSQLQVINSPRAQHAAKVARIPTEQFDKIFRANNLTKTIKEIESFETAVDSCTYCSNEYPSSSDRTAEINNKAKIDCESAEALAQKNFYEYYKSQKFAAATLRLVDFTKNPWKGRKKTLCHTTGTCK